MKNLVSNMATVVLTACALLVTGLVVRREFFTPPAGGAVSEIREVENWEDLIAAGHVLGSRDVSVKIIEFSDFECPFCGRVQPILHQLRAKYPNRVAVIFRHFPLSSIHPHAATAALAAECAGAQDRFEAYHDALFQNQDSLGVTSWETFAEMAKVPNREAFHKCVEEQESADKVQNDVKAGERIGVSATPTFIVNGKMFSGSLPAEQWDERIREALKGR